MLPVFAEWLHDCSSAQHSVINGHKQFPVLSVETECTFPLAAKLKADPSGCYQRCCFPGHCSPTQSRLKVKEESEESDEDLVFQTDSPQSNQLSQLNLRKVEIKAYFSFSFEKGSVSGIWLEHGAKK